MQPSPSNPATALHGGILVGGRSRRMGTAKALLELDGTTFFERVERALLPVVDTVVVLGRGELPSAFGARVRLDDVPGVEGPLGGLLAAFAFAPGAAWILVSCDLPLWSVEAVRWLVSRRSPNHWAILPRLLDDAVEPLGALYEPSAAEPVRALAASGERSLQPLAAAAGVATPRPPAEIAAAWHNVNTPEELEALRRT